MILRMDRLKPSQPYFVLDTRDFYQEVYLKQGISHFYTYKLNDGMPLRIVPDGCIDFFFEYGDGGMQSFVCGTPTIYTVQEIKSTHEIFGVRFMPGAQPRMLKCRMRDLLSSRLTLQSQLKETVERKWLDELEEEKDFYQRIRIFIQAFTSAEKKVEAPYGKDELVWSVKQMIYESNGNIKISNLQESTGYSSRYINKVFLEEMGFSPKVFCRILRFQRALELLNDGELDSMTALSTSLGYYDQSQFIHDFSNCAGTTPGAYRRLVESRDYRSRIKENL